MLSLNIRRAIVWILSVVAGAVATLLIFLLIQTTPAGFGIETIFVVIPLSIVAMIWLDYFLSAEILPD